MAKVDYKKELKYLYNPSQKDVVMVDVPDMNFLMIDGSGDPNKSQWFEDAVQALYSASYALKFMLKKDPAQLDYVVLPLEGLWWVEDMTAFSIDAKDDWEWTLMIMQPCAATENMADEAIETVQKKKDLPALSKMRFERYYEGLAAQIMHIGPYAAEGPTVEKIHRFAAGHGYRLRGKHHEIYLSDPRKTAPEKMKTVIRQPVK